MAYLFWIIFWLFLFVGLFVILTNNPVHSVLALVLIFFFSSCLALALGVEFLAVLILIVYVGAISVLFLFVVMLLNIRVLELNVSLVKYWWLGILYSTFFSLSLFYSVWPIFCNSYSTPPIFTNFLLQTSEWFSISQFGELIFLYFPHLLFVAALVLFVAIVSPVVLTYITFAKKLPTSKFIKKQDIFLQSLRNSVDKNF